MRCDERVRSADDSVGQASNEALLFAQAVRGGSIARSPTPELQLARAACVAPTGVSRAAECHGGSQTSQGQASRDLEILEWSAGISTANEAKYRSYLLSQEVDQHGITQSALQFAESLLEGDWDPGKHPRGGFSQNRGWWSRTGGSAAPVAPQPARFGTTAFQGTRVPVRLAGTGAGAWPTTGSASSLLPNVSSGAVAGAAAGAGLAAGGLMAGLRNASMGAYWERVPATQVMPSYWAYDLDKRVRAGTLSEEDALGIYQTAVLGAEAQKFKPTGNTMAAVHKTIMGFLGQAEAVYFARKKKKAAEARSAAPGAYQQSGGRVFPTARNSGLTGHALRVEQERFFERGLSQGKAAGELRGQAHEAGAGRTDRHGQPDHLDDPEIEAALQRALIRTKS